MHLLSKQLIFLTIVILFSSSSLQLAAGIFDLFFESKKTPDIILNVNVDSNNSHNQSTSVSQTSKLKNTSLQNQQVNQPTSANGSKKQNFDLSELISHYKYHIIGTTFLAAYGSIFALILMDHWYIKRKDTWGSWKQNISLDELKRYPMDKLMNELIHDIQRDHILTDPIDASASFTSFMSAIDYEINRIKRYLRINTFLQRTKLLLIFPTNAATIKMALNKQKRITFLKQSFLTWAANYKMQHHLKLPHQQYLQTKSNAQ